jgi:hypothetical protein
MVKYWYIPFLLIDVLRDMVNQFRALGGYVIVTSIEPESDPEVQFLGIGTGIIGQDNAEVLASLDSKGFCIEGDLHQYGYATIAQNLGCLPFDTSAEFLQYIETI